MLGDPKVVLHDIKHTKKELLSEPLCNKQPSYEESIVPAQCYSCNTQCIKKALKMPIRENTLVLMEKGIITLKNMKIITEHS